MYELAYEKEMIANLIDSVSLGLPGCFHGTPVRLGTLMWLLAYVRTAASGFNNTGILSLPV